MIAPTIPPEPVESLEASERPLPLRIRADLAIRRQSYQSCTSWVVKDPLGLRYFRFRDEEYAVLTLLDGNRSLEQVKREYDRRFSPERISLQDLWQFISSLHQSGLVTADAPGQGEQLLKRRREQKKRMLTAKLANVLALRVRGIDPDRLLTWMLPGTRWLFSPAVLLAALALGLSALLLVTVEFHVFQSRLPDFYQFFSLGNSAWLLVAMSFAKILHEFGHGLSCKHFGGECHEMGAMFLVFTPCLYCNVSDSWLLPSKWQRAAIGAAGMYIEMIIASICTFLWWFSQPGLFNHLCLNLMFVCSVSTVLFNANPLLRFDGYYILSDLSEIPNLRTKATRILNRAMARWCLGMKQPDDPLLPQQNRGFFAAYAIAAVAYRWVITVSIMLFLLKVFEPYRLESLGHIMIGLSLFGLVIMPLWKLGKFFHAPGRLEQVKRRNLLATLGVLAAVFAVLAFVPFPHRVKCEFTIEPHDAEPVYVHTPGVLQNVLVKRQQPVAANEQLAELVNLELTQQMLAQQAELVQQELKLEQALRQRFIQPEVISQEQELRESIATLQQQLATKQADLAKLKPVAPRPGKIISPPAIANPAKQSGELPQWSGYPFDRDNLGAVLNAGVLLCYVGNGERWEAVLNIHPGDVEFVTEGQAVEIMLKQDPGETWQGKVDIVARREVTQRRSASDTKAQQDVSAEKTYLAIVVLDDEQGRLRAGLKGRAKIYTAPQTLLSRAVRWMQQTF